VDYRVRFSNDINGSDLLPKFREIGERKQMVTLVQNFRMKLRESKRRPKPHGSACISTRRGGMRDKDRLLSKTSRLT
jgi:hypothetical protein